MTWFRWLTTRPRGQPSWERGKHCMRPRMRPRPMPKILASRPGWPRGLNIPDSDIAIDTDIVITYFRFYYVCVLCCYVVQHTAPSDNDWWQNNETMAPVVWNALPPDLRSVAHRTSVANSSDPSRKLICSDKPTTLHDFSENNLLKSETLKL